MNLQPEMSEMVKTVESLLTRLVPETLQPETRLLIWEAIRQIATKKMEKIKNLT